VAGELKSTLDIVMEKLKGTGSDARELTPRQKELIADIRRKYDAKIAETKILMKGSENLPMEIAKLEEKREAEIQKVYQEA